jgi:hypothetical protein
MQVPAIHRKGPSDKITIFWPFQRDNMKMVVAANCSAKPRMGWENTVNRLVAGSNPARGAKSFNDLLQIGGELLSE